MKIQPRTIDLSSGLWGITAEFVGQFPRAFCCGLLWAIGLWAIFDLSKLVFFTCWRRLTSLPGKKALGNEVCRLGYCCEDFVCCVCEVCHVIQQVRKAVKSVT